MLNSSVILGEASRWYADKTAVVCTSTQTQVTFAQLEEKVNQLANGLKNSGIQQGDKVMVVCPNRVEFPILFYAILKIGAIMVPVNILSKRGELEYYLDDTKAKAIVCIQGNAKMPTAEEGLAAFNAVKTCEQFILIATDPNDASPYEGTKTVNELMKDQSQDCDVCVTKSDDTAVILYTAGTTGQAKGAELTHQNLFTSALNFNDAFQICDDDKFLVILPLFHTFGQTTQMNNGFLNGCTLVLLERFDPERVLELFVEHSISVFCGVPTMYWGILNNAKKDDIAKIRKNLRLCVSGGAPMPVELINDFERTFGNNLLMEGYGLTETASSTTMTRLNMPRKIGSCGIPHWGVKVMIVDEDMNQVPTGETGEVVIQGHCTMKGYLNKPEATAEAYKGGWFHTGDMGKVDEDGYYYIVDRLKDMVIRGGYNVYPREIEEKMIEHPDISLVAVIGIPDKQYGEEIIAFVIPNDGATSTEQDLIKWTKTKMANYKYPRQIRFVDSIPMSATNKILKRELRKMV